MLGAGSLPAEDREGGGALWSICWPLLGSQSPSREHGSVLGDSQPGKEEQYAPRSAPRRSFSLPSPRLSPSLSILVSDTPRPAASSWPLSQVVQDSSTSDMIFSVAEIVSFLRSGVHLRSRPPLALHVAAGFPIMP